MIRRTALIATLGILTAAIGTQSARAFQVVLNDRNTEVHTDFNSVGEFYQFSVDGVDHLEREWYWIRVNDDTQETKITGLVRDDFQHTDGNFSPGDERVFGKWHDPQDRYQVTLDEVVTGGPINSGVGDVTQTIRITNLSDAPLRVNLFGLSDYDVLGTKAGDTATVISSNVIMQTEANSFVRETFTNNSPTTTQMSEGDTIFNSLNDNSITTLDGTTGPFTADDVSYGVQWITTIPVGGAYFVTKDIFISAPDTIVPEPASASLLGLAGLLLLAVRRRNG